MHDETSNLALIVSCFDWYEGRIDVVREAFLERAYCVKVLTSDFSHIKKERSTAEHPNCEYIHVPAYSKNVSLARVRSHLAFASQVNQVLIKEKPKVVYLLIPPNKTADYCRRYRNNHPDTKLIIDVIDLWPESLLGGRGNRIIASRWKGYRDRALECADYVFTECDLYQEKLDYVLNPERSSILYLYGKANQANGAGAKAPSEELIAPTAPQCITFGYLGSINNIIDIDGICELIKTFVVSGVDTCVKVIGDGESRDCFLDALTEAGCSVSYYGPIYDGQRKAEILGNCGYGLNMMKDTVSVGLSIKSIDYLSMGVPLANNIKGDTWRLVEERGIGFNIKRNFGIDLVQSMLEKPIVNLRRNAAECYNELFTKDACGRQLVKGLDVVLGTRS